jgi:flagellar basal-body rod protein FlgG
MTTIQGSIAKLVNNANTMFESLGYLSTNVANMNTIGYKAQRFENYMNVDGTLEGRIRTDYSQGGLTRTGQDLDIGIDGAGFIPVTSKNGTLAYTRNGSLAVNNEGYLVTQDGWLVGDGIKVPANYEKLDIETDGTIKVLSSQDAKFQTLGKIPLVTFNNPEGLNRLEGNKVGETNASGKATLVTEGSTIKQGTLERANVDVYTYVNENLKLNGSLISSTRLVKVIDDLYRQAINLRQ